MFRLSPPPINKVEKKLKKNSKNFPQRFAYINYFYYLCSRLGHISTRDIPLNKEKKLMYVARSPSQHERIKGIISRAEVIGA